jgi:uncharacterized protein YjbJ (UPF0337 family)
MPKLITPKIDQDTPAYLVGTTQSRVSFFLKKYRKPDFMDYNHEWRGHSSLLIIVLHEDALIINDHAAEAAPNFHRINSCHLSNLDQTTDDLLPIMKIQERRRGDNWDRLIRTWRHRDIAQEGDIMNADQLKGKWMQFKGELKQQYGKFTDDDLRQIEGNYDTFLGKVQERYGDKKDALMKWADQWHEQSAPDAAEKTSH